VGAAIAKRIDPLANTVSSENGKVRSEALLFDVVPVLLLLNHFLRHAPAILADEPIDLAITPHRKSYITYRPKGVVAVISPWNFPLCIPAFDALMALIAGNAVVIKPSEVTPLSALALEECVREAGIDPDLLQVVTGLKETGAALIDARPDHVVFTGSVPAGRSVGVACAERMIDYTLELGGKAPAIVLEDADLERTANAIVWGGFANAGQICACVERVYAVASVYDPLVARLSEGARGLRVGPPNDDDVDIGAITWPRQIEIVEAQIADARAKGARVTAGGERVGGGRFFAPTILADCSHDMDVMRSETFGPIVPLMKVDSEDHALELANDSTLGLGAYVFTRDIERGRRIAERLDVGSVMINDVLSHAGLPETPWGGIKHSGRGVVRSARGLRELCHARHVNHDRFPGLARDPHWFPYSPATQRMLVAVAREIFADKPWSKWVRRLLA
jgi:succinate-semialdehyde dehydrogenase/glutarate-semialdehyde dehydrogenase